MTSVWDRKKPYWFCDNNEFIAQYRIEIQELGLIDYEF